MHALLEARDLSCGYQGEAIFNRLNFTFEKGQFAGLVGPSGSGKTTFIKSLLGLIEPWRGQVYFQGRAVYSAKGRRENENFLRSGLRVGPKVGYVPQVETVDWNFPVTAAEVVMMGRYRSKQFWPWPSQQDRDVAHQLLTRVGAAEVAHRAIGELSGGQQQRVFLARALVGNPDLVLLDEPTSSADVQTQHELLHLLWDLNDQGVSILLSTHDLNSVATHLPWVICFNHEIVAQGRPLDVLTPETLSRTFGGDMVVETKGDRVLIANRATTIRHPVQRPRPAVLPPGALGASEVMEADHSESSNLEPMDINPGTNQPENSESKNLHTKGSALNNNLHNMLDEYVKTQIDKT